MESKTKKKVKSGVEFDSLFPLPSGKDLTIKSEAGVSDTVAFIHKTVPLTLEDTKKVAPLLKGKDLYETCRNIWHFVYDHIPYKKDKKAVEQVRRPARSWWDRKRHEKAHWQNADFEPGIDCDCMTALVHSLLMNLGIKAKSRITIYNYDVGYQHIYPVVPIDQKLNFALDNREDYIVIDCVKDQFDEEHPFLEYKDYPINMRLDYLNGIDDGMDGDEIKNYDLPPLGDVHDLFGTNWNDDEMGELGKLRLGKALKKVGKAVGKGIRVLNRFTNPATIMLRNGFLLAMKVNFMNVAKRLRWAYLSDEQAKKMGMNLSQLAKVRNVKNKAEKIYYTSGGKTENLKKAILNGKGNKDKKVPLNGLQGLGEIYGDQDENDILNGLGELGVAPAAAMAAATTVLTALAATLKQVKGLFPAGSKEESAMSSDAEDPASSAEMDMAMQENVPEPNLTEQVELPAPAPIPMQSLTVKSSTKTNALMRRLPSRPPAPISPPVPIQVPAPPVNIEQEDDIAPSTASQSEAKAPEEKGMLAWMKKNPLPTAGIVGAGLLLIGGGIFLATRKKNTSPAPVSYGMNGVSRKGKRRSKQKTRNKKLKVRALKLR